MFAWAKAHSVEILLTEIQFDSCSDPHKIRNLRHSIHDTLAWAFAILFAGLSVRIDNFIHKLAHRLL